MQCRTRFVGTLRILCLSGLWGVAYDADHLLQPIFLGQWPTWDNLGGRVLHIPLLIGGGCVCIWTGALFAGLLVDTVIEQWLHH